MGSSSAPAVFDRDVPGRLGDGPRLVICGSFRRATDVLKQDFDALGEAGGRILAPRSVDFVADIGGFVLAEHELGRHPHEVESDHLAALQQADFVWLHAPSGYVGLSAALELGVAYSLGVSVFARQRPSDPTLEAFVTRICGPEEAVALARAAGTHTPARPLDVLQEYYRRIALQRGYENESAQDAMLLLTEEVGELARAVRRRVGLKRSGGYADEEAAVELADIQLYLLHMANVLDIRLATAVMEKEGQNEVRSAKRAIAA